jgi:5-methylcytosine-specific restriction endonuclease McrA
MACQICGNELTGLQLEACSRPCRIKLDGIKRREAGRLRKANMSPEKYARLQAQKKADAAKRRAEGRNRVTWGCVSCGREFEVKRYSEAGYWCSNSCRMSYWSRGIKPSQSSAIVIRPKPRPQHGVTVLPGRRWTAGTCEVCNKSFVSRYRNKTCSPLCQKIKYRETSHWIAPRTRMALYERDGWTCHLCNEPVPQDLEWSNEDWQPHYPTLDHVVPRSHGGKDEPSNLRLAHMLCNTLRGSTPLEELQTVANTP